MRGGEAGHALLRRVLGIGPAGGDAAVPRIDRLDGQPQAVVVIDGPEERTRRGVGRSVLGIDEQRPVELPVQRSLRSRPLNGRDSSTFSR